MTGPVGGAAEFGVPQRLRDAYATFVAHDEREETALARERLPQETVEATWRLWHRPGLGLFLDHCARLRLLDDARDCASVTGSLVLGLRLLRCLRDAGIVRVAPSGALTWEHDVVGEPVARNVRPELMASVAERLSPPDVGLNGQCAVNPEASLRRATKIVSDLRGDERGVMFLGDSDLVSMIVADLAPVPVLVAEIDDRTMAGMASLISDFGLRNVTIQRADMRFELPAALRGRASVCVMDPIDGGTALGWWLARTSEALCGELDETVYISINTQRIGARRLGLQRHLTELGFALEETLRNFHEWPVPDDETDEHIAPLRTAARRLGIDEWPLRARIYTDLLVFRRLLGGPVMWPQDHAYLRRAI
jgi:hypothetical protein